MVSRRPHVRKVNGKQPNPADILLFQKHVDWSVFHTIHDHIVFCTGFDSVCAAHIFNKLMKRLGFNKYYLQGGDWGWLVTTNMAQLEPKYV